MDVSEIERRRASVPAIGYPAELPISRRRDEIVEAVSAHPVVIVSGDTGSGKSTQLPKMCLDAGLGVEGWIGHTQPRRLAARTIAARVASELEVALGSLVGCTVRFHDEAGPSTLVKAMTDGILLAEARRDPRLSRYQAIIVDEAHERTLNIDFLLGLLRRLIDIRDDLKLIVTSATIDTERFADYFDDAPVIEVGGRSHPIEIRYRPLDAAAADGSTPDSSAPGGSAAVGSAVAGAWRSVDWIEGIERAVSELLAEQPGDVLVFCSGEREIRDTVDQIAGSLPDVEVLPLFARLSPAEQLRVFAGHSTRRVVVATNVAETSLTVPGIRSVVDAGSARISRFNRRTKVQRLPIEPISRASADQRAGRCGRLGPGVCIRLYSEDDYLSRPEFTEPEIMRTNLAAVVLQMAALGLGDPDSFAFLDPPQPSAVRDGVRLLVELGAVNPGQEGIRRRLTLVGEQMAELPLDPRLARMLIAADEHGCVAEMLVIVSGLAIQDPRIRPSASEGTARRQSAEALHARFDVDGSDFLSYLRLWRHIRSQRGELSGSAFRRMCRQEFLHYLRVREWQDLHAQLTRAADRIGLAIADSEAEPDSIHRAALSGLLSRIGVFDPRRGDYRGARSLRFRVAGTSVAGTGVAVAGTGSATEGDRRPAWLMAAEMIETERVLARVCAPIDPDWIEAEAAHLLRWEYSTPWWDAERGAAVCTERAGLYGLEAVADRTTLLHRVDPGLARHMLIRHSLVRRDSKLDLAFMEHNRRSEEAVESMQTRLRRDDLLLDEERLIALFETRLPDNVVTEQRLEQWWRLCSDPQLLCLAPEELTGGELDGDLDATHPDIWRADEIELRVDYRFDPGALDDGMTIEIPLEHLQRLDPGRFEWLVPGYRRPLIEALLRTLPKTLRRALGPAADAADRLAEALDPQTGDPLLVQLAAAASRMAAMDVAPQLFDCSSLPAWLRPHYRVTDDGDPLAEDDNLDVLRDWFVQQATEELMRCAGKTAEGSADDTGGADADGTVRHGLRSFGDADIPTVVTRRHLGQTVRLYPALADEGSSVSVRLFTTEREQAQSMWEGTRRLLLLQRPALGGVLRRLLTDPVKAAIVTSPYQNPAAWLEDCLSGAADAVIAAHDGPLHSSDSQLRLLTRFRSELSEVLSWVAEGSIEVLRQARQLKTALDASENAALAVSVADIREQLDRLVYDGFVAAVGVERLDDLARYLRAARMRTAGLADKGSRDAERTVVIRAIEAEHEELAAERGWTADIEDLAWQIQELRVSLFAQSVGAAGPVSVKRIRSALDSIRLAADA